MTTRKLLSIITLAAGMTVGASAYGVGGDIYEMRPCDLFGNATNAYATIENPMTSGETIYFRVTLIRPTQAGTDSIWKVKYTGTSLEVIDEQINPLRIGIFVSGQLRFASLVKDTFDTKTGLSDLVFAYKTRPGDVAFPIVLASEDGKPITDPDVSTFPKYMLVDDGKWAVVNDIGGTCNFSYCMNIPYPVTNPDGKRMTDYSLAKCGFYVQTIGFDDEWEVPEDEPGSVWRSVHENSTITVGATPKLVAAAAPEDKVTLHVWSMDDNSVRIKGGRTVQLITGWNGVTPIYTETQVGDIVFAGGQMSADFQIEGVTEGSSCNLVMSPWDKYSYSDGTGSRVIDYVTVPVRCIEPMPPTVVVESDRQIAYANGDFTTYAALLTVYLSQACESGDVKVRVTPSLSDGTVADLGDYVRVSAGQDEVADVTVLDKEIVFTIPKGSTGKQQFYVYCLRGDTHTTGTSHIIFTPTLVDPTPEVEAEIKEFSAAALEVRAEPPVITAPSEGATITGICGDKMNFTLAVSDTFADSSDVTTGYKVFYKYRAQDAFTQLDGVYYVGEGGQLFLLKDDGVGGYNKTTQPPVISYPGSGEGLDSQVYVVAPISGKKSEIRSFKADIKEARTSTVSTVEGKDVYYEGEQASFQVTISEKNDTGKTIYAYLKASNNAKAGMFSGTPLFVVCDDTDYTKTSGLAINKFQDTTTASKIMFLDGLSEDAGGFSVTFEVVLCDSPNYDPNKRIAGYDSNYFNVTVFNKEPTITRIEMNGFESENDGYTYEGKIPKGMKQSFKAIVADKGKYDLTNTEQPFTCKWTASLSGVGAIKNEEITGNPALKPFEYDFPRAGNWTIKLQVKDKDMEDWSEVTYSVNVTVLDNPTVDVILPGETISEADRTAKIQVQLSYWDTLFTDKLKVKLVVDEYEAGRANPGFLKLDSHYRSTVPGEENVYYIEVGDSLPVDIAIEAADGTLNSSIYGFKLHAEIVSDSVLPTSSSAAKDYYIATEKRLLVENAAPNCFVNPQENTNRWEVAGSASSHPINWTIRSDVDADFEGIESFKGIKVTFIGCDNATEFFVNEPQGGKFVPDFGSAQGDVDLTLTIEDKDGGLQSWTWQFTVIPSKMMTTIANGPSNGTATSPLSRKYAGAVGRGAGHTFVADSAFTSSDNFRLKWNCGSHASATIFGYGYHVGAIDNGSLNDGNDRAVNQDGKAEAGATVTNPFSYAKWLEERDLGGEEQRDSYFYCWIKQNVGGDNGAVSDAILGDVISPERPTELTSGVVPLPTEKTGDGNYLDTYVEAVFALEFLPGDNLGDLNQDGVPDYYAIERTWANGKLIPLVHNKTELEGDLLDLGGSNIDEDYLPGIYGHEKEWSAIGGKNLSYAPVGPAFTTKLELRGFGEGLNDPDTKITISAAEFSENEQKAWEAYANANGLDAGTPDLSKWSPEPGAYSKIRHMDPTTDDTDGDNLPDAWEYYFWYQAHVEYPAGAIEPRHGQIHVFESFDPHNIIQGKEIDAAKVEEQFNPLVTRTKEELEKVPDFDNDGLSDYEELLIGTNPCHWDTDGDRMCDGWEVMMCLDPLGSNKTGNEDGDFFAQFNASKYWAVTECEDGLHVESGDTFMIDLSGKYLGDAGKNYWWEQTSPAVYDDHHNLLALPKGVVLRDFKAQLLCFKAIDDPHGSGKPYTYGLLKDRLEDPLAKPDLCHGFYMTDQWEIKEVEVHEGDTMTLPLFVFIHDQVRDIFGFDPRTGWYKNAKGYVAARWYDAHKPEDTRGLAINTSAYCNYDEYLVMRYRLDFNKVYPFDPHGHPTTLHADDIWGSLKALTTNPSAPIPVVTDGDEEIAEDEAEAEGEEVAEGDEAEGKDEGGEEPKPVVNEEKTASMRISELLAEAFAAAGSDKAPVTTHGADTDQDGVPDGWELYTFRDPGKAYGTEEDSAKHKKYDLDEDGLVYKDEYAGTDSCNAYQACESIYKNHPGNTKGWFNKFFPSNPGFQDKDEVTGADSDGDGIKDGVEGGDWEAEFANGGKFYKKVKFTFIYGKPTDDGSTCIRGGGSNPLSCDTDLDGLPDAWEAQFAGVICNASTKKFTGHSHEKVEIADQTFIADGIWNGGPDVEYIAGGQDSTWAGDGWTDPMLVHYEDSNSGDELLGTVRDVDWDHDGLQNWQEYLVQAVRHFRYDDITTPLMGRLLKEGKYEEGELVEAHEQEFIGFLPMLQDAKQFSLAAAELLYGADATEGSEVTYRMEIVTNELARTVETNYIWEVVSNVSETATIVRERMNTAGKYQTKWDAAGWEALGYMSKAHNAWDPTLAKGKKPISFLYPVTKKGYVSTDPRMNDTDRDGMDDYYEMFHGLNPILGTTEIPHMEPEEEEQLLEERGDIIAAIYGRVTKFNAFWNEWTHPDYDRALALKGKKPSSHAPLQAPVIFDPVMYPWAMGVREADADGDGLRNSEEAILANVTSPMPSHTDPSPYWFTDFSSPKSYVAQYYLMTAPVTKLPFGPESYHYKNVMAKPSLKGGTEVYVYPFEQNEGYDTDGDWLADQREMIKTVSNTTDPLVFSDPVRRQAAYFDGVNSFMMTYEPQYRPSTASDLLKQFTVECWVRPEESGREQTIIERSACYPGDALTKLGSVIRANFRIGLHADGRVYGLFDNSDALESGQNQPASCQRVDGSILPLEQWSHVALSYDGHVLTIYVNGLVVARAETSLIPANGVVWSDQYAGNKKLFPVYEYKYMPVAFFIGARPQHFADAANIPYRDIPLYPWYTGHDDEHLESFDNYREYFKGYVDEVRIWDGARTSAEILDNLGHVMTSAEAAENREAVYESWVMHGTRNDNDGKPTLPAELVQHYDFTTLPGAVDPANVAKVPYGFDLAVEAQAMNGYTYDGEDYSSEYASPDALSPLYDIKGLGLKGVPDSTKLTNGINVAWWDECEIHSLVYDDTRVVPWVKNTVAHLPIMDGSCVDTWVYADKVCLQYAPAAINGLDWYAFPNTAMPYPFTMYNLERYNHLFCLEVLTNQLGSAYEPLMTRYQFEIKSHFIGTSDLLPMGNAYAKTCPQMWDGAVADAWEVTGVDADNTGIPDWWEEYARNTYMEDPSAELIWDSIVTYNGIKMSAWQAYLIDLSRGQQPDGSYDEAYISTIDADNDILPDWWEKLYGLAKQGLLDDPDHDGLSNYVEWRVAYGDDPFGVKNGWPILNPNLVHTDPDFDATDYFITITNEPYAGWYLGEVMTDHDFMEDSLETDLGTDRKVYDPYSDWDEDGWTAWSELRYSKFKASTVTKLVSHIVGEDEIPDSPVPVVHATIRYNGEKIDSTTKTPIVIQAYSGNNLQKKPIAKFTVKPGETEERHVYLGQWEDRVVHGTLTPGFVKGGLDLAKLEMVFVQPADLFSWSVTDPDNPPVAGHEPAPYVGTYKEMFAALKEAQAQKYDFLVHDQDIEWSVLIGNDKWGNDNASALQISVDSNGQTGHFLFNNMDLGDIDLQTGDFTFDMGPLGEWFIKESLVSFQQGFFRITYPAQVPTMQSGALSVSLAAADTGALREGGTSFIAFGDLDGNGEYDPLTEPAGFLRNVAVSWDRVNDVTIEMLDAAPSATRLVYDEDVTKVRIIRYALNGETNGVNKAIAFNRSAADSATRNLWDCDFITTGRYGLDWVGLRGDIIASGRALKDITTIGYQVVIGDELLNEISEQSIIDEFTITYPAEAVAPTCVSPSPKSYGTVYTARPTFTWTGIDGNTAFRLQIADAAGEVVYSSDVAVLPARDTSKRYTWKAPVYVGTTDAGDYWSLANNSNYSWRVAMYNPKFSDTNDEASVWSDWTAFKTAAAEANDFTTSYGTAKVDVRYYGPATNVLGDVIVQLFRTADFTGLPAAQVRLADLDGDVGSLTNGQIVTFVGLESGDYYATAFIDRNGSGYRDRYESWGYYNRVGQDVVDIYTPCALKVNVGGSVVPFGRIYIEDTDLNQNDVLDPFDDIELLYFAEQETAGGGNTPVGPGPVPGPVPGPGGDSSDNDGDGLTADEESDTGTDASLFDTDGDGMPDGWEARFAGTSPVNPDGDKVVDGDVMAYVEVACTVVADKSGREYILPVGNTAVVGDDIDMSILTSTYDYPVMKGEEPERKLVTYLGFGTNLVNATGTLRIDAMRKATVVLVHAQVYDHFGFCSKTAVADEDAIRTKPFTALDKYLVSRYLTAIGCAGANETVMNRTKNWASQTLKPGDPDNDRDGVADGWELYVMFGNGDKAVPTFSPWNYNDRLTVDPDGDGLGLRDEYDRGVAPTDPWNACTANNGIPDGLAWQYHIKSAAGMMADADGDGLNNYVEYLLSEVFDLGKKFDPDNAYSVNPNELDYFFKIGSVYVGEIFTDFDMIEDEWEASVGTDNANPYVWDALADNDDDGWSNFDECRYADFTEGRTIVYGEDGTAVTNTFPIEGVETHPTPAITIALTYGGKQRLTSSAEEEGAGAADAAAAATDAPVVITTYTDSQLIVPDAQYTVHTPSSLLVGKQVVTLTDPDSGYAKGGLNTIVAFCDLNGDGVYTPGEPMGMVMDVDIGWSGAATEIELTDVSPIITRADLTTGESDRHTLYGTDDGDRKPIYTGDLSGGKLQHIQIIRTLVDGYGVEQQLGITEHNTILDKWIELDQRSFFFEGDILANGQLDLDWDHFEDDVVKNQATRAMAVTNVSYRIVLGNGSTDAGETNNLFEIVTSRHFDGSRAIPVAIAPGDENAVVYGSRPTFKWTTHGLNSYTAFKIVVMKGGSEVWNSGLVRTPACSKDGVYSYTPDLYVDDILENNQNYTWKVAVFNAKFKSDIAAAYSSPMTFRMNTPTDGGFYGELPVCVKYYGPCPTDNLTVCVEAYASPDFSGYPVARAVATNLTAVTKYGETHVANVTLRGLAKGRYYLLAYLDGEKAGRKHFRDEWESWGYLCPRERSLETPFKPIWVELADAVATPELPVVYIEDADTNGNKLPDMWEIAKFGDLKPGSSQVVGSVPGGAVLNKNLNESLKQKEGTSAGGLTTTLETTLTNAKFASLLMGVAPEAVTFAGDMMAVDQAIDTVTITSLALDGNEIVLGLRNDSELKDDPAAAIYNIVVKTGVPVRAKVYFTETLAGEWELVAEQDIVISSEGGEIRAKVDGLNASGSGFYRVELAK